jgi:hypothetical protein
MADYWFGLVVEGVDLTDDDEVNRLVGEGIDDASFAVRDGSHIIYLDRQGPDLIATVAAAVTQVEGSDPALRVVGLESEELLTQSGVAEVAGRTRQNIHQHVHGSRGTGFPAPVGWADGSRAVWLASDVSTWAGESEELLPAQLARESLLGAFILVRCGSTDLQVALSGLDFAVARLIGSAPESAMLRKTIGGHLRSLAEMVEAG